MNPRMVLTLATRVRAERADRAVCEKVRQSVFGVVFLVGLASTTSTPHPQINRDRLTDTLNGVNILSAG